MRSFVADSTLLEAAGLQQKAQVIVIGGGIIGCAVLYHLVKAGCTDVVLLERKQLTAGSTWHAAAGFHSLNGDPAIARLQAYTVEMYDEIERTSDQSIGIHRTGGLLTAAAEDRWEFLQAEAARHKVIGLETELVTPEEIKKFCPIMNVSELRGGLYDAREGHIDPHGVTQALAQLARVGGAKIKQHCLVEGLEQQSNGDWRVETDQGDWHTEHIVNAAGLWAREVGAMAGVHLPLAPFEHHYLISEVVKEIEKAECELAVVADLDGGIYLRQEGNGVLFGVYEQNPRPWAIDGTPWDYGESDLLPNRLDDLEDNLLAGFERFPAVAEAGIKRIVNGPFTFTPDGNPLIGPVRGVRNYWAACGCMAGFSQGGGLALALSQWIINGEPEMDVQGMDVARFGEFATQQYVVARGAEFYEKRFALVAPNEPWESARPLKVSPLYSEHKEKNAVFGAVHGQETPMWFAPEGMAPIETPSFRRSNAFTHIGDECRAVRNEAGVFEISGYGKYVVAGAGAAAWLDHILACRLPGEGRAKLAPMLSDNGRLIGDLTVSCMGEDQFLLTGSGSLQEIHMRWFEQHLPENGVFVKNVTDVYGGLSIVGPNAQNILQKLTLTDLDTIRFLGVTNSEVAMAPTTIIRISLTGEKGYEVYAPSQHLYGIYKALFEAGASLGLKPFGVWALMSLRLEKGYGIWSREFTKDDTPEMSGLDSFVDLNKGSFVGKEAMLARTRVSPPRRLKQFIVDSKNTDALGFEPIFADGKLAGYTTSGGYGHSVGKSIALGYLSADFEDVSQVQITILGNNYDAEVCAETIYDPRGLRLRS